MNLKISIILFISFYILSIQGLTYVQMIPYLKPDCTGEVYGVGYSWQANTCIGYKNSNFWVTVGKNNVTISSWADMAACGSKNGISRHFEDGGCYSVTYADNGDYISYNYVEIQIVEDPGPIPEYGYRETLYAPGDKYCQGDYQFYYYYTNQTVFKSPYNTYEFLCSEKIPYIYNCATSDIEGRELTEDEKLECYWNNVSWPCSKYLYHHFENYVMDTC
eukprot:gene1518-1911_t